MSKLQAALALAARGLRVFPLRANTKDQPLVPFTTEASSDPSVIRAWWTDPSGMVEYDHNLGVLTTGLVVADIDTKGGKPGLDNYLGLGLGFDTFMVRTPSGGFHAYYGPGNAGQSPVAEGLDIRSHNGYVVGPGSTLDGVPYAVEIDAPISEVPVELSRLLKPPGERGAAAPAAVDLDRPDAAMAVVAYLQTAPVAIEGCNGNDQTYKVAQAVRDLGVSEDTALGLLLQHWNERCIPAWDYDDLAGIVRNAFEYGQNTAGKDHPEAHFGGVVLPPVEEIPQLANFPAGAFMFGQARDISEIRPRDWIVNRLLLRRYVSGLVAPGGASKSTHLLTLGAHLAYGAPYAGFKLKQGRSIIYNAEDDLDEQHRRLHALCSFYGFDYRFVMEHMILLSEEEFPVKLAKGADPTIDADSVGRIVAVCREFPDTNMVGLDPLANLHDCDENDPVKMRYVVGCASVIARQANVGVMLSHHTKKPSGVAQFAGDVDAARGSGAITNAMRVALTLTTATERDCEQWAINEAERHEYVRLDDAKMNLTLRSGEPVWFRKYGVRLSNGDEVGVVRHVEDMRENAAGVARQMAAVLLKEMTGLATGGVTIGHAVSLLRSGDPIYQHLADATLKSRIDRYFSVGVEVDGNRLRVQVGADGKKILALE